MDCKHLGKATPLATPLLAAWCVLFALPAEAAIPATVTLGDLVHTYDGTPKVPSVVTDPPGLNVNWHFVDLAAGEPQPVTETVYQNTPDTLELSYQSISFSAQQTWGYGDYIGLAGAARNLESVDVVMVTWAKAGNYPVLAAADPTGWRHPVTLTVYDMNASGVLTFRGEVTREIVVPWRPLTLPNGDPYPVNGFAFKAHFDFPAGLILSGQSMIMVSFNTENTGFAPIGSPGPYNELNVAIGGSTTTGTDIMPGYVLWVRSDSWSYPTRAGAPRFVVKASRIPEAGTSQPPVNAGTYAVTATIDDINHVGTATDTLEIRKAEATVLLGGLTAIYDGTPKAVSTSTVPSGLKVAVTYNGLPAEPVAVGRYNVQAEVADPNYQGAANGELWLGHNLDSWLAPWVDAGSIAGTATGWSDDPDRDTISNLLEYGFALDPASGNHGLPARGMPQADYANGTLSIIYRRNLAATDLVFQVESAPHLNGPAAWSPATTVDTVLATENGVQTIRAALAPDGAAAAHRFLRLRVERR